MLTPEYLDLIPDSLDALFQEFDEWVVKEYVRRIEKAGKLTETAQNMANNAELVGLFEKDLKKEATRVLRLTESELERIFGDSAELSARNDYERFLSSGLSADRILEHEFLRKYIDAAYKQTVGEFKNLTGTMGFAINKDFLDLTEYYRSRLDFIQLQISNGMANLQKVIRTEVKNVASKGVQCIQYESGRKYNIASAARMCTLTGVNQMAMQLNDGICDELNLDIVETTAHAGARPSHQLWQGQRFSRSGESKKYPSLVEATKLGDVTGLCGANCRHNYYGVLESSPKAYSSEQLNNIDPPDIEYDGKSYTYYEACQYMRYMERQIRKTKREIISYEAVGYESEFVAASIRLNRQKQEYKKFAKVSKVRPRLERTQEIGFNRSVAQKAVHRYER